MTIKIIDTHCHLDFPEIQQDFAGILERAKENGVFLMQTICTKMSEMPKLLEIAEKNPQIFASVGVHPNEVDSEKMVTTDELVSFTKHPKVIGLGETGLDHYYETAKKELQIESFRRHLEAARITQLPVIIHTRDAEEDTIRIVEEEMQKGEFKGLIHCFTSSYDLARKMLDLGLYISISGIITFKNAEDLRESVKKIPLNRILIETDSPYLAPVPKRGKNNEPAFVKHVGEFLAELRGINFEEFAEISTNNFFDLFSKVKREEF